MNKWKQESAANSTTDNDLVNQFVAAIGNNQDRFGFQRSINNFDQQYTVAISSLYDYYAPLNYQTNPIAK